MRSRATSISYATFSTLSWDSRKHLCRLSIQRRLSRREPAGNRSNKRSSSSPRLPGAFLSSRSKTSLGLALEGVEESSAPPFPPPVPKLVCNPLTAVPLVLNLKMEVQVPYIPEHAPFSPAQRAWLNGFLAGLFSQQPATSKAPAKIRVNVYFGTETGNSEAVAKRMAKFLQSRGFESQAINLSKISSGALAGEAYALIVTSTFGDGDPPDSAKAFYT